MAKTTASIELGDLLLLLKPFMADEKFKKNGNYFRRVTDDGLTQVVQFQKSSFGSADEGQFAVNLGVAIPEVHRHFQPERPIDKVSDVDCHIQARLGMLATGGQDVWWPTQGAAGLRSEMEAILAKTGLPFLASFSRRDQILAHIRQCDVVVPYIPYHPSVIEAIILNARGQPDAS
ncbi:DUF4304 domain-containing protein [Neogemmobacter tilapiae]|uniref:DUF4304 domain-containing protein n=1 Tax=Neogemmobacter tilapiae TaxID=875041 RepID=UPI00167A8528|nr:DUF4304 domain-containing protein [Gemmobacter tilapiae]